MHWLQVRPAMQKLQACFLQLSNGADTVPTHVFRDLLQKLLPQALDATYVFLGESELATPDEGSFNGVQIFLSANFA